MTIYSAAVLKVLTVEFAYAKIWVYIRDIIYVKQNKYLGDKGG